MIDIEALRAALVGREVIEVHDRYGDACLMLSDGSVVDIDAVVSCGSFRYGGSADIEIEARKAFDDEGPLP